MLFKLLISFISAILIFTTATLILYRRLTVKL